MKMTDSIVEAGNIKKILEHLVLSESSKEREKKKKLKRRGKCIENIKRIQEAN